METDTQDKIGLLKAKIEELQNQNTNKRRIEHPDLEPSQEDKTELAELDSLRERLAVLEAVEKLREARMNPPQTDYQKQANDFLAKAEIVFSARWIGRDCPPFCEDKAKGIGLGEIGKYPRKTHIHGDHWLITLRRDYLEYGGLYKKEFHADYWDSYKDASVNSSKGQRRGKPTPYDLLACLEKYPIDTFDSFYAEYGYDSDSRRAFGVYESCQDQYRRLVAFFDPAEMEELREIQ